ncbi:TetR/AcrR family transcriptional regulator [Prauserella flavalba]|uniref:TetR family transcriptional regulator n=1 Tax=Prauserella flavalba TaxID=1477506 RepID=A0A318LSW1_9PSEU|nr:TetR/AcrR family transcriptional regulator [Prauserella flavalba]PXY35497.1 TetR family transcriptional regulator [Prauserella flavalba]
MARRNGAAAVKHTEPAQRADWRHFEPLELTPILAAALEAFYEHGFHGTTVRDIARRVGQTVPSLYYHHENKEGVFATLLEMGTGDVAWRAEAAAAEAGERADLRFAYVVEAVVLYMTHRVRLAALDPELRHLSPPKRKRYAARRKEVENLMAGIVEDGVRQGVFTAELPAETARAVLGMCQSIGRWYQPSGPLAPEELAGRYVDIALMAVGVRKRPQPKGPQGRRARVRA